MPLFGQDVTRGQIEIIFLSALWVEMALSYVNCRFERNSRNYSAKVRGALSVALNNRSSFQTQSNALTFRRAMTTGLGFVAWQSSLIVCVTRRISSSQDRIPLKQACFGQSQPQVSARCNIQFWIMCSIVFEMQEVNVTGLLNVMAPCCLPNFFRCKITEIFQIYNEVLTAKLQLNIARSLFYARGPKALEAKSGMKKADQGLVAGTVGSRRSEDFLQLMNAASFGSVKFQSVYGFVGFHEGIGLSLIRSELKVG